MSYPITRFCTLCLFCFAVACFASPGSRSAVAAGKPTDGATRVVRLDEGFKLKVGQRATLKEGNLRIKFAAVDSESRCPRNVRCVWAGNAQVVIEVGTRNGRSENLKLNTMGSEQLSSEGKYKGYTVRLVDLSPYPQDGREITPRDYTATLVVGKQ